MNSLNFKPILTLFLVGFLLVGFSTTVTAQKQNEKKEQKQKKKKKKDGITQHQLKKFRNKMNKDKKYRKQVLKGGLEARLALAKVFGPEVALKTKVKVTYHDLKKSGKTSKMNFSTTVGLPKLDVNESQFDMSNYPESEHASKLAKIKFYFPNWNNYGVANTDTSACNGEYDTEDTSWTCIDENAEVEFLTRLRVRGTTRSSSRGGQ